MMNYFKTRFENFHLINDEIILTRDRVILSESDIGDLNIDHQKSKKDLFKSLTVIIFFIIVFIVLTVYSVNKEMIGPTIISLLSILMFSYGGFYNVKFKTGNPKISKDQLIEMKIRNWPFKYLSIKFKIDGQIKYRCLPLTKEEKANEEFIKFLKNSKLIE